MKCKTELCLKHQIKEHLIKKMRRYIHGRVNYKGKGLEAYSTEQIQKVRRISKNNNNNGFQSPNLT